MQQQKLLMQLLQQQIESNTRFNNVFENAANTAQTVTVQQPVVVATPGEFSFQTEDWVDWKTAFNRYKRTVLSYCSSEQQVDYLISFLGIKAEKIIKSFHLNDQDSKDIEKVLGKFDSYFNQKRNLVYELVKFLQRSQKSDEPCDIFINDLTMLAQTCEWGNLESEMIKLRIIAGLGDNRLSVQLQSRPEDSLDEVINRVRLAESLQKQQNVVSASSSNPNVGTPSEFTEVNTVNRGSKFQTQQNRNKLGSRRFVDTKNQNLDKMKGNFDGKACRKCGIIPRHEFSSCPANNSTCNKCGKKGHWEKRCLSKQENGQTFARNLNEVTTQLSEIGVISDNDVYFLGNVDDQNSLPWRASVLINNVPFSFKIDTGADVTVLKAEDFYKNKFKGLEKPTKPLLSASGNKIDALGVFESKIQWRNKQHKSFVYVANKLHDNLLGRGALGMLSWAGSIYIPNKYPNIFDGIGNLGKLYHITLRNNSSPYSISSPRRVPLHLKDAVKSTLDTLESQNIIVKITQPTNWCAPMVVVPKKDNKVRICVDYTALNKSVQTEHIVLPEITETLAQIDPAAKYFSKLDATSGFYHIPLDPESQLLTTFITPFGRYAYLRLPMGITSAPERFQCEMFDIVVGLKGVVNVADDTLVFGCNKEEHDERLDKVLKRFEEKGLRLNKNKCIFGVQKLVFLGHVVSNNGISIDSEKLKAILEMPAPSDVSGVRRILGCLQTHAKFLPKLADLAKPIHELLGKNIHFCWTDIHQQAFEEIKKALTSSPILDHFAPGRPTRVAADASSYGLGAALEQKVYNMPWRPVWFASRTMSDTEKRYAQIEWEALAATWACEKFKQFLLGQNFIIQTDHKPLVQLLGAKPVADLPARIQRFRMRLMQFSYTVEYIPGRNMCIPDLLSRAPIFSGDPGTDALLIDDVECFAEHISIG